MKKSALARARAQIDALRKQLSVASKFAKRLDTSLAHIEASSASKTTRTAAGVIERADNVEGLVTGSPLPVHAIRSVLSCRDDTWSAVERELRRRDTVTIDDGVITSRSAEALATIARNADRLSAYLASSVDRHQSAARHQLGMNHRTYLAALAECQRRGTVTVSSGRLALASRRGGLGQYE